MDPARVVATGAGAATAVMGVALTGAPDRMAALLGLDDRPGTVRMLGLADLVLAPVLLGRRSSTAMVARATLNAVIVTIYHQRVRRAPLDHRARIGRAGMAALVAVDGAAAIALSRRIPRGHGTRASSGAGWMREQTPGRPKVRSARGQA